MAPQQERNEQCNHGGRVKTLTPEIHAALVATPEELVRSLENPDDPLKVPRLINLAYVDLYPFTSDAVRANIDLGGRALLNSAVKGNRIATDSTSFRRVLDWLERDQPNADAMKKDLGAEAMIRVAKHTLAIANWLAGDNIYHAIQVECEAATVARAS